MKRKRFNRPYIPRREFKFWLRKDREGEARLIEFIQYCKSTRQFASKVRDGLRLIWSLSEGNTSVLFELFPHLEQILIPPPAPPSVPDSGDLERLITTVALSAAQQVIDNLPALPPPPPGYPVMKESAATNTLGQGRTFTAPIDDDEDTLNITKSAKVDSGNNLFTQMMGLMNDGLQGTNHTADANARSLEGRRVR